MLTHGKKLVASAFLGAAVLFTPMSTAAAQSTTGDGLVNVAIGDVTILEDVNIALAAQVAANICRVDVGPIAALGTAVDVDNGSETVCRNRQGPIKIEQN